MGEEQGTLQKETAKVKEKAGFVTGDRRVEAEGRAERQGATPGGPDKPNEEVVEEAEDEVRADHGDI